jgi:hypothetical protein
VDWEKFEKKLDEKVAMLQREQLTLRQSDTAAQASVGAAAIVLGSLSAAIAAGRQ